MNPPALPVGVLAWAVGPCARERACLQHKASHDADERTRTSTGVTSDTDLNRARLPIPPHPRAGASEDIAPASAVDRWSDRRAGDRLAGTRTSALLASDPSMRAAIVQGTRTPPSHGGNPGSNPGSGIRIRSRQPSRLRPAVGAGMTSAPLSAVASFGPTRRPYDLRPDRMAARRRPRGSAAGIRGTERPAAGIHGA